MIIHLPPYMILGQDGHNKERTAML